MKVLLADDEAHVRNVIAFKFKSAGHSVVVAADGAEALELARLEMPDIIISDFQMPELNGLEFCTALFADEKTRAIPVVMVTSRDFDISPEQMKATNIRQLLSKPFSPKHLLGVVHELLGIEAPASQRKSA